MNRVIIIGAGFSKAVANAPLANEIFESIYQQVNNDYLGKGQWQVDREQFLNVVNYLQKEAKPLIDRIKSDGTQIETCKDKPLYPIDIEYLCTILDLNIERPYVPKGIGKDLQGCPIPFMGGLTVNQLKGARNFIIHYIVKLLLPDQLIPDKDLLDRTLSFVQSGDVVITFNYDLLVEQALWKKQLWSPHDGYVIGRMTECENINANNLPETKVPVIKMHGSINWLAPYNLIRPQIEICCTHPCTGAPLFEGLNVESKGSILIDWNYQLNYHVIIPTFMKSTRTQWELKLIRKASEAISNSEEILILGYSIPEADAMANFILTNIKENAHIRIVDKYNAVKLADRLAKNYGIRHETTVCEQSDIKTWVDNNFKCKAYEEAI